MTFPASFEQKIESMVKKISYHQTNLSRTGAQNLLLL